jgi:hypothetical protein
MMHDDIDSLMASELRIRGVSKVKDGEGQMQMMMLMMPMQPSAGVDLGLGQLDDTNPTRNLN